MSIAPLRWRLPWRPVLPGESPMLEAALKKEISFGHVLLGVTAMAVARRVDNHDVLFALFEGPAALAVVRLGFAGRRSQEPDRPVTLLFDDWDRWRLACMADDATPPT